MSSEKNILVSIIVPIYQVEQYLNQCIESIISQTYKMIEVILVDDGSNDSCGKICDDYGLNDKRIKVIHKDNGGLVSARKAGIAIAKGFYVTFVDGDDWIEKDYIDNMVGSEMDSDIIIAGYTECSRINEPKPFVNGIPNGIYCKDGIGKLVVPRLLGDLDSMFIIAPAVWNKLFKRAILEHSLTKVNNEVTLGEDIICSYSAILEAESIVINNNILGYNYRLNDFSMTGKSDENYVKHMESLFICIDKAFENSKLYDEQLNRYKIYILLISGIENVVKKSTNRFQLIRNLYKYNSEIVHSSSLINEMKKGMETNEEGKWIKQTLSCLRKNNILGAIASETILRHFFSGI